MSSPRAARLHVVGPGNMSPRLRVFMSSSDRGNPGPTRCHLLSHRVTIRVLLIISQPCIFLLDVSTMGVCQIHLLHSTAPDFFSGFAASLFVATSANLSSRSLSTLAPHPHLSARGLQQSTFVVTFCTTVCCKRLVPHSFFDLEKLLEHTSSRGRLLASLSSSLTVLNARGLCFFPGITSVKPSCAISCCNCWQTFYRFTLYGIAPAIPVACVNS